MIRRMVLMRHGERVDFTFGESWITESFDQSGNYIPHNLNMPLTVVQREGLPYSFRRDSPLTQVGYLQGKLVGQGLRVRNVLRPNLQVYVSPALRSVQTATAFLEGLSLNVPLKIEPSLFEWTGWYNDGMPAWLTVAELVANGYNIDTSYEPFTALPGQSKGLLVPETAEEYYIRSSNFVNHILQQCSADIVLVGHGSTLDACTRTIIGAPIPSHDEMMRRLRNVPYAGAAIAEQESNSKKWKVLKSTAISIRHSGINDFDAHKVLNEPILS